MKYFETIKIDKGKVFYLPYHQWRIQNTIGRSLEFSLTPPDEDNLYRTKVIYDANGVLDIAYYPYTPKTIKEFVFVDGSHLDYKKKYLDRSGIEKLQLPQKETEIIIVKDGLLSDTSIANLAFYDGKVWLTPKTPLLEGTTRKRYIEKGVLIEADIEKKDLLRFSKIATLNAMVDFAIIPNIELQKDRIIVK